MLYSTVLGYDTFILENERTLHILYVTLLLYYVCITIERKTFRFEFVYSNSALEMKKKKKSSNIKSKINRNVYYVEINILVNDKNVN